MLQSLATEIAVKVLSPVAIMVLILHEFRISIVP